MARKSDMNSAMRSKRKEMMGYMYPGDTSGDSPSPNPDNDVEESEPKSDFTVIAAGDPDPGTDGFIYEPYEGTGGAWVVYPPGVPCDQSETRVSISRPATADDFVEMQEAVDAEGPSKKDPESPAEDAGEMGV